MSCRFVVLLSGWGWGVCVCVCVCVCGGGGGYFIDLFLFFSFYLGVVCMGLLFFGVFLPGCFVV